ncbi:E3 ubiquitin-protein ligase hel2 [Podospora australis]|uniref:RING-type E3 ubiquitin transferase n=1 Tax=Podospora australis TaxID=1536484 RepID=A0AAN6X1W6_9PEZI|nr:E3 ubiquitin-protein ligase hel2 [Podospora australis]
MDSTGAAVPAGENNAPPSGPRGGDGQRGRGRGRGGPRGRGRGDFSRGRGRGGGGGRGGHHHHTENAAQESTTPEESKAPQAAKTQNFKTKNDTTDDDAEVCFICANTITHYSVAPCNHVTCHLCALRLRALYKSKDCPHCRTSSPYVIFTDDGTKRFEEYTSAEITSTDDNIGIKYAGEDIVGDTVLLLRYNCPDAECDFAGLGWVDLHRHVRSEHNKKMCDLCTRHKKVFTHEHEMFADRELTKHMRDGDDKPGAVDQTGFKGHPLCGFCGARFYDSDKLYEHCRNKHERCFLCDRRDSRQPHYYLDYDALEHHFKKDHFLCNDRECLEKKFVVFESEMDLKAHQLSEHGGSTGAGGRGARTVDLSNFDLRQRYEQERRGGGSGRDQQRRRVPDASTEPLPVSSAQPLRRDELAFQRQMAINSGGGGGGGGGPSRAPASTPARPAAGGQAPSAAQPSRARAEQPIIDAMENLSVNDLSSLTHEQRASLTRHGAVLERASNLLGNDATKMNNFRSYISNYNKGSVTSSQLIEQFFNLFDETSTNAIGTLVREVADLFQDKKKGEALLKAWQNRRAVTEDYPSLPSLGGMRGATTATSGWASAAAATPTSSPANAAAQQRNSNRVLKLKSSTRRGSFSNQSVLSFASASSGGGGGSSAAAAAAGGAAGRSLVSSASSFPALPSAANSRQTTHQPSWIGGSSANSNSRSGASAPPPTSRPAGSVAGVGAPGARRPAAVNSQDAFPALPAAPKPKTTIFGYGRGAVRRDFGQPASTGFSWSGGGGSSGAAGSGSAGDGAGDGDIDGSGQQQQGGNKKKNKKQVLAHWG